MTTLKQSLLDLDLLMNNIFFSLTDNIYDSLYIFLLSIAPISELRGAIIYGLTLTDINKLGVISISIIGNGLASIILIYSLRPLRRTLQKINFFDILFKRLDARVQRKGKVIKNIRFWGLVMFVGVPLPVTGAWTGSFASVFFDIDPKESIPAIMFGLFLSAAIVTTLVLFTDFYLQSKMVNT